MIISYNEQNYHLLVHLDQLTILAIAFDETSRCGFLNVSKLQDGMVDNEEFVRKLGVKMTFKI